MSLNQELEGESEQLSAPVRDAAVPGPPPRGRPWAPGQSGNPRGRPSRARQAARVAEALIQRKTVPLANKALELALAGDRTLLRACLDRIAPPRREPPVDLDLPAIANRDDLRAAMRLVAEAAAAGTLSAAQSDALARMFYNVLCAN